jgi:hypothetical protein
MGMISDLNTEDLSRLKGAYARVSGRIVEAERFNVTEPKEHIPEGVEDGWAMAVPGQCLLPGYE